ncbi:MAG: tetratricopeptide repeat protein [Phycisphaeraceae bacterium]|nr:tetratricopeptide repeat protein [Phycisphaeraceae bacterium]
MKRTCSTIRVSALAAAAASGLCIGAASAQSDSAGGVPAPMAPPIPSVQGVKSKAPPPSGVGRKGTLLNRTGTLLPPPPTVQPRPGVSPLPRPIVTVPSRGLQRPIAIGPGYVAVPNTVVGHSGSGLSVDGSYSGDRFNLRFHVGSGYTAYPWWRPWDYSKHSRRYVHVNDRYWYPWIGGYNYRNAYETYDPYAYRPVVYGQIDPFIMSGAASQAILTAMAQQAISPPREPTVLERADALLAMGDARAATEAYRRYLEDVPDDAAVMRSLALALMEDRRLDESVAVLAMAYQKSPRLARTPIDPALIADDVASLRRRVNSAVGYANRVRSGSAWLLAAVLVQAEGRDAVALSMIDRGRDVGLSEEVAAEMTAVLKR